MYFTNNPLKIGNISIKNRVVLAPLAEITDYPFREIVRILGGELTYSEMIACQALLRKNLKTIKMATCHNGERPVAVQLVGSNPTDMAEAAKICEDLGATFIDINMGCPQKKIIKTGAGAALMKEPNLAAKIVESIVKAVSIPVTCKIRLGWNNDSINALSFSKQLEVAGASMIAIHARTRAQMFSGKADWKKIKPIKEALNIPIIANGDILTPQDAKRCLEESSANGVMIGRGTLGRPWLIGNINKYFKDNKLTSKITFSQRKNIIFHHLELIKNFYQDKRAILTAKKHLSWYIRGFPKSAFYRNEINRVKNFSNFQRLVEEFFIFLERLNNSK